MGFSKAFGYAELKELTTPISKNMGLLWLIACILLITSTLLWFWQNEYWWLIAFLGGIISQIVIFSAWQDAKFGTLANIFLLILIGLAFADWQFNQQVNKELKNLKKAVKNEAKVLINQAMLVKTPPIVQKWLTQANCIQKGKIRNVQLKQTGQMRLKPNAEWINFEAVQYFNVESPAFIWKTNIQINPFIFIVGRDKFEEGKGNMLIKALAAFPIANAKGLETDQGTMLRYLAEICWFPSAALNEYIQWEAIDALSAKATMRYEGMEVSGTFFFTKEGDIKAFEAMRYGEFEGKFSKEKWHIDNEAYADFQGIRIPAKSTVTWQLKEGDFTWLKLKIEDIQYNVR
jgi:hypothetical protein